jgi:hypothetical protein
MKLEIVLILLAIGLMVPSSVIANSTEITSTNYEVGVPFEAPFGNVMTSCYADDWSVAVDWGDGQGGSAVTRHNAVSGGCGAGSCIYPGTSQVWDTAHIFQNAGDYTAKLVVRVHCWKTPPGTGPFSSSTPVKVWGRVPVKELKVTPDSAPAGAKVKLTITLGAPAPPSNTRVDLKSSPDVFTDLPRNVTIPSKSTELTILLTLKKPLPPSTADIEAVTAGSPVHAMLKIL